MDSCNGALKNQVLKQGPPVYLASTSMLPLPSDATHVDVLWFAGGVPQVASSTTASEPEPAPEPEPEPEPVLAEFAGDARYLSARLQGSVDGEVRERLWDMHKQVYAFSDPTG